MAGDLEGTLTAQDLLDRELALEEEAAAKMQENWGDEDACTYVQGYITQPIYACATCTRGGLREPFGFCFGCSMNCHVDHDVYELFDKRHFRCDCGTPKSGFTCKFADAPRTENNVENKYTQNFDGKYCWCNSAYDPDVDIMSQCVICEDWFHHTCVSRRNPIPDLSAFKGFVCHNCVEKVPFFLRYPQLQPSHENENKSTNTDNKEKTTTTTTTTSTTTSAEETKKDTDTNVQKTEETKNSEAKKEVDSNTDTCILQQHPATETPKSFPDIFLIPGWRKGLCKCAQCSDLYRSLKVEYLLDAADDPDSDGENENENNTTNNNNNNNTNNNNNNNGNNDENKPEGEKKKRSFSMFEAAEKAFLDTKEIPHSNKLNIISGFSDMKSELMEYLRGFAENGKVVTQADITEFFEEFRNKKQRK